MSSISDRKQQALDQYKVVAHLARSLALVHEECAEAYLNSAELPTGLIEIIGRRSASIMEQLGDILNGMDANDKDDAWVNLVFARALEAGWKP